jgi:hypothetical protein
VCVNELLVVICNVNIADHIAVLTAILLCDDDIDDE